MKAWAAATALVAFFAVGSWYLWHGDAPAAVTTTATSPAPAVAARAAGEALRSAPPGATRVMVVGNSIAHFLAQAMPLTTRGATFAVFDDAIVSCEFPPQLSTVIRAPDGNGYVPSPACHPKSEVTALARFRPAVALWIPGDFYGVGGTYHGRDVKPCTATYDSLYRASLRSEITRLGSRGAQVVLTTQAYVRGHYYHHTDAAIDCDNRLVREVAAATHTRVLDLFDFVCPNGQCRVDVGRTVLRPDGVHYQGGGATLVAQWILDQIH